MVRLFKLRNLTEFLIMPWGVFAKSKLRLRPHRLVPCNATLPDLTVHIGSNTATVTGTSMLGLPINASSFSNFSTPGESPCLSLCLPCLPFIHVGIIGSLMMGLQRGIAIRVSRILPPFRMRWLSRSLRIIMSCLIGWCRRCCGRLISRGGKCGGWGF